MDQSPHGHPEGQNLLHQHAAQAQSNCPHEFEQRAQAETLEKPLAQDPVMAEIEEVHYHVETVAAPTSCGPEHQQEQAKHPTSWRLARRPLPAQGSSQAHCCAVKVATTSTALTIAKSWTKIASKAGRRSPPAAKPGTKIASVEQVNRMHHPLVHSEHSWTKSAGAFAA